MLGATRPKAGLVREELLINVSEIPNWKNEWRTTRRKINNNKSTISL